MLIAKTRRDVVEAVKASKEQGRVVHVTNAAGTHTVAIRVHAATVHFGQPDGPDWIQPKWYGLASETEMLDDIADWLLYGCCYHSACGVRTSGGQYALRPTHRH